MGLALIASAGNNANEYLARHAPSLGTQDRSLWPAVVRPAAVWGDKDFEVVIINAPLPDEFGHELALHAVEKTHAGVLLLVKNGNAEQIGAKLQERGILVLGKPFSGPQFRQAMQIAASCYRRLDILRAENARLADKIAQLRLVDRAKCYLIEHKGYTEADAHRYIEKQAMDTRRSRGEIAMEILEENEAGAVTKFCDFCAFSCGCLAKMGRYRV